MWNDSPRFGKHKAIRLFNWFHAREAQLVQYPEIVQEMRAIGLPCNSIKLVHMNIQTMRRWYPEYVWASAYGIGYVFVRRPDDIAQPASQK